MTEPTLIARAPITQEWKTLGDHDDVLLLIRDDVPPARTRVLAAHFAAPDARWITDVTTSDLGGADAAVVMADPPLLVLAPQTALAAPVTAPVARPSAPNAGGLGSPAQAASPARRDNGAALIAGLACAAVILTGGLAAGLAGHPAETGVHVTGTHVQRVSGECVTDLSDGSLIGGC